MSCALIQKATQDPSDAPAEQNAPASAQADKSDPVPTAPTELPKPGAQATQSAALKPSTSAQGHDTPPAATEAQRIQILEERSKQVHEQLEAMKSALDKVIQQQPLQKKPLTPAVPHPATESDIGVPAEPNHVKRGDPDAGFIRGEAVNSFKTAIYLFKAEKYPESVLAFVSFVDHYPDHPLAGNAQFYIGESYFRQREYRLAVQEFDKVIASYDRSSAVPLTLRRLSECKDNLKLKEEADRHLAMLNALFPNSPAMPHDRGALAPIKSSSANGQHQAAAQVSTKAMAPASAAAEQLDAPPEGDDFADGAKNEGVRYDPHWGTQ